MKVTKTVATNKFFFSFFCKLIIPLYITKLFILTKFCYINCHLRVSGILSGCIAEAIAYTLKGEALKLPMSFVSSVKVKEIV